ncbi:MAG: carboxymuconolactone decarboxylase family protein [Promethearchaeota archaeon]
MDNKYEEKLGKKTKQENLTRLSKPRITPMKESEMDDTIRKMLKPSKRLGRGRYLNIFTTLIKHPKLYEQWNHFGSYILGQSTLSAREREILILRIGWLCKSEYEWGQHVAIGKSCGLKEEDFQRIIDGPDSKGLDPFEATLLRAVDELYDNAFISDSTWNLLSDRYNDQQLIDLIFTVGQYNLVSMVLNTLGIQLDEGYEGFPK